MDEVIVLPKSPEYKVVVICLSYNQEKFIEETLKGFVMQKTNFPFCVFVIDDFSQDNTANIIREYEKQFPNVIKGIFLQENYYSQKKSREPILKMCYEKGEYVAFCEGDDCWLVENKLQKQIDFLDSNTNYSCCYTKYYTFSQSKGRYVAALGEEYKDIYEMLWKDVSIATCSFVCRSKLLQDYLMEIKPTTHNWLMGDKPMFLYMGHRGLTKLIPEYMCKYRILETSASHSTDIQVQLKRARNTVDIYQFFANRYFSNDKRLFDKLEGAYLYRAYYFYKNLGLCYPDELKNSIKSYKGCYHKLYVVKILLEFPILEKLLYGTLSSLQKIKMLFVKK